MALESAANFKAAIATAAADLTTAWTDTVVTRTAEEIRNAKHPLRQIEKLFLFNSATGVVAADDDYIDACYAGDTPNKGNPFDVRTDINQLALVSADVEIAEPADIVLVFNKPVSSIDYLSIAGTVTTEKTIVSTTIVGATVTIVVSSAYIATDTISVSGNFNNEVELGSPVILDDEAVTNNIV